MCVCVIRQAVFIAVALLSLTAVEPVQTSQKRDISLAVTKRIYFLVDRSSSMDGLQPPETTQAVIQHLLELASLAQQPIEVCVITYGVDGVRVFGNEQGRPSAAYQSLQRQLFREWPKAAGGTPMDDAFEKLLVLLKDSPADIENIVVNISDGVPDSGRLRPDEFAEIGDELARRRKAVQERAQQFPPAIQQELVRKFEEPFRDPGTLEFKELYAKQQLAEYRRTLEHAAVLAQKKVRFLSVDYVGIPNLKEIHEAAGGQSDDLLRVAPNQVIGALHGRKITALPRIVHLPDQEVAADPGLFECEVSIPVDAITEAASISIEFQPAVPELFTHCQLTAEVDGSSFDFNPDANDPETDVTRDAMGNVATASLRVENIQSGAAVKIRWASTDGSMAQPAMRVYAFARLKAAIVADLRPAFQSSAAVAPFQVAESHDTEYVFRLRDSETEEVIPVSEVEAVFRSQQNTGKLVHSTMRNDPQIPGQVRSEELRLSVGSYDVDLAIRMPSGIEFSLSLSRHLEISSRTELIAVEIPWASTNDSGSASKVRSHTDFGVIGDEVNSVTREILVRTVGVEYPVPVRFSGRVADSNGSAPTTSWIQFRPEQVTLQPGKAERIRITMALPARVDAELADGVFEGAFAIESAETRASFVVRRLEPVSGVPDDAPVETLSFELKRPRLSPEIPYAFRNWIRKGVDGGFKTTLRVDIDQRFSRIMTMLVAHDSVMERTLSVLPTGLVADREGRSIPQLRLVPTEDTELTQTIAPGETGVWYFQFETDDDCDVTRALTGLDITGDGITPEHVTVEIQRRDPLLVGMIYGLVGIVSGFLAFRLLRTIPALWRAGKLCTGAVLYLRSQVSRAQLFTVGTLVRGRLQLIPLLPMEISDRVTGIKRRLPAERVLTLRTDQVSPNAPYILSVPGDEPTILHITDIQQTEDGDPEVCVEVFDGGSFDRQHSLLMRRLWGCLILVTACVFLIFTLKQPSVLRAVQWLHDAILFD